MTVLRARPAKIVLFLLFLPFGAAGSAAAAADAARVPVPTADTQARIDLYAPRVRRSTVMYLRLRLLELREEGLERARAAIERRLSIDDLLAEPPRPPHPDDLRGRPHPAQPPAPGKAKGRPRRTPAP